MKLKASTLIESIVALTIISIAFGATLISFATVTNAGSSHLKIVAAECIQQALINSYQSKDYTDKQWSNENILLSKKVDKVEGTLLKVSISAYAPNGTLLNTVEELVIDDTQN